MPNKLPESFQPVVTLLTSGASLMVGLLSFSGMFALWPSTPLATAAFMLSIAYEGEIYKQNIHDALLKLVHPGAFDDALIKRDLIRNFAAHKANITPTIGFFSTIDHALQQHLQATTAAEKQQAKHLLSQLYREFSQHPATLLRVRQQRLGLQIAKLLAVLTALTMSLSAVYLLLEAFALIPFLAALPLTVVPFIIIPLALIAGIAYGVLTFNTLTHLITDNTLVDRLRELKRECLRQGVTLRTALLLTANVVLLSLGLALTLCTAGTWLTIVQNTPAVFEWIKQIPTIITHVLTPLVSGCASFAFNIDNSNQTLDMLDAAMDDPLQIWTFLKENFQKVIQNVLRPTQGPINPYRVCLNLILMPMRVLLFLGHLISIGVISDRMPGVSKTCSTLIGLVSELFEDAHYFFSTHNPRHDSLSLLKQVVHPDPEPETDLPSKIVLALVSPLIALEKRWDSQHPTTVIAPSPPTSPHFFSPLQKNKKIIEFNNDFLYNHGTLNLI